MSYRTREPPHGCARQGLPYGLRSEAPEGSAEVPGEADRAGYSLRWRRLSIRPSFRWWQGLPEGHGTAVAVSSPAELLLWVSLPHDLTFPFGRVIGAVGSHWSAKRYGGASINPGP